MNSRFKDMHFFVLVIVSFFGILMILFSSFINIWMNFFVVLAWSISFSFRNIFLDKLDKQRKIVFLTYLFELILLYVFGFQNDSEGIKYLYLVTAADSFIAWGLGYGMVCTLSAFVLNLGHYFIHTAESTYREWMIQMVSELQVFLFMGFVAFLMNRTLRSNQVAERMMMEIALREVELKAAYQALEEANQTMEKIATLKERNRIAREIHDTVGHTITNVIVEMEAGKMLMLKNQQLATEKYEMAQQQAVKALEEIRSSVRMFTTCDEATSVSEALLEVIEETELHTGVHIKRDIDLVEKLPVEISDIFVRALKEGLTNGIRHGYSTAFVFQFKAHQNQILFSLQDNGRGCKTIYKGFGLTQMQKSIEKFLGRMDISSEVNEGFELTIEIPFQL